MISTVNTTGIFIDLQHFSRLYKVWCYGSNYSIDIMTDDSIFWELNVKYYTVSST